MTHAAAKGTSATGTIATAAGGGYTNGTNVVRSATCGNDASTGYGDTPCVTERPLCQNVVKSSGRALWTSPSTAIVTIHSTGATARNAIVGARFRAHMARPVPSERTRRTAA